MAFMGVGDVFASVLTSPCISRLTMQFLQPMFANTSCRHSHACQVKTVKSVKLHGFCKVYFLYCPCKSEDHASNSFEESRHQSFVMHCHIPKSALFSGLGVRYSDPFARFHDCGSCKL